MELSELIEGIRSARSLEDAWSVLQTQCCRLGFSMARYGLSTSADTSNFKQDVLIVGDQDWGEFGDIYEKENLVRVDPTVRHCMTSTSILTWCNLADEIDYETLTAPEIRLEELSMDFGLNNGLSIPLRNLSGVGRGGLTLQGDPNESAERFAKLVAEKSLPLRQMAEAFHCSLHRPLLLTEDKLLSPRERECLLWTACGLQAQQIADKLGTHTKTVEKQLCSARTRLGAYTTTQAVVKAIILGLLDP